ncbi:MAG: protein kinase domain-containing protein [Terracidiphilus sp.]
MSVVSGTNIGPYEILSPLGAGGMGEVYRARDTRLNREVAIKVLPRAFAEDPPRMARFEREAQLLASLNHPKIAAIYGLEESGATRALVMELVEGPTLAERIGRAPVSARPKAGSGSPAQGSGGAGSGAKTGEHAAYAGGARKTAIAVDEALPIAQQMAEALEYAHEHGVVHRDLKPANVKVTPDGCVKVLDFGLAKAMGPESASGDISNSPTLSLAMTEAGLIIGTAAYMAPEQARGKPVDRRADIWAFGCVLYEMLTGQKAFEGETVSDVLAAVIMKEPDWSALPETVPISMQRLIRRCLQKDPHQRLQAIGDARIAIEEALSGATADSEAAAQTGQIAAAHHASRLRRILPWALAAAAILFAAYFLFKPAPPRNVIRFAVPPPENAVLIAGGEPSISPDSRTLAFIAEEAGPDKPSMLWLRPLNSMTAQPVAGTEGASTPFWSPDSRQVGFFAAGKLEKVAISGGSPVTLCDANQSGGTWNRNGAILFTNGGSIYRVSDSGGTPALVLAPDAARHDVDYRYPQFLPNGRHFLFDAVSHTSYSASGFVGASSLDSKTAARLAQVSSIAFYSEPGYLVYLAGSTLMARPFDARGLRFTGQAVAIAQDVFHTPYDFYKTFAVSPAGLLAYQTGALATTVQLTWFSRAGDKLGTVGQPGIYTAPALSPDGARLAVAVGPFEKRDIWVYDLKRGTASRLTFNPADDTNTLWSADGTRIVFSSNRDGQFNIYQKDANGEGSAQSLIESKEPPKHIDDLSPDGRYAIYDTATTDEALWGVQLSGDRKPFAYVQASFRAKSPRFSPNGRYVAYSSTETGSPEVYVQTFPQHTGKWQISASGGDQPMWSRDGKELFYLDPEGKLMYVDIDPNSATFQAAIPKTLFQTQLDGRYPGRNMYVVSPDGQRFLMLAPAGGIKPRPITVVVNWPEMLKSSGSN